MAIQGIGGLGGSQSGLDIEGIVTQLVALERQKSTKINHQLTLTSARAAAYSDLTGKMNSLKTQLTGLKSVDTFGQNQKMHVSDEKVFTATRTGNIAPGGYQVEVLGLARAEQHAANASFTNASADDQLRISVGGGDAVNVDITAGDDTAAIASKINGTAGIGVYATVVEGQLYVASKQTGSLSTVSISSRDGNIDTELDFGLHQAAANATYKVNNGAVATSQSNTVKNLLPGVDLAFKSTGTSTLTAETPSPDVDKIAEKLQKFVDSYNETLQFIADKTAEKKIKEPKSDFERTRGIVSSDRTFLAAASALRQLVPRAISGAAPGADQLADLGIKVPSATEKGEVSADGKLGKLTFDKEAFKTAYANDPNNIKTLITNATEDENTEGFVEAFTRKIETFVKEDGILDAVKDSADATKKLYDDRKAQLERRVVEFEKRTRAQFASMERILGGVNTQGSALISGLRSMGF